MVPGLGMEGRQDRHPPYQLKYIDESHWENGTCWGSSSWTKDDSGWFHRTYRIHAITLIINQDAELLKRMREEMMGRKTRRNYR